MKHHSILSLAFCCFSFLALSAPQSHADIAISAREIGGDVVFSYSGSIDLSGLSEGQSIPTRGSVYPVNAYVEFGPADWISDVAVVYIGSVVTAESAVNFGTGGFALPTSAQGDYFSVSSNSIKLPVDYTSEAPISGSMTFGGKSLADLYVAKSDKPYVWVMSNGQKITLTVLDAGGDNGDEKAELEKKIKKLKKEIKAAKAKSQKARVKKLTKKLRWLKSKLEKL